MNTIKKRKRQEKKPLSPPSPTAETAEPDPKKPKQAPTVEELEDQLEEARQVVSALESQLYSHPEIELEQAQTRGCAITARRALFEQWARACVRDLGAWPRDQGALRRLRDDIAKSADRRHYDYIDRGQPGLLHPGLHPAVMLHQIVDQGVRALEDARGEIDFDIDHGGRHTRATLVLYPSRASDRVIITAYRFDNVTWRKSKNGGALSLVFMTRALADVCRADPTWICQQLSAITAGGNPMAFPTTIQPPPSLAHTDDGSDADGDKDEQQEEEDPMAVDKQLEERVGVLEKRVDAVAQFIGKEAEERRKKIVRDVMADASGDFALDLPEDDP